MTVTNTTFKIPDSFAAYQGLPYYSHSGLKYGTQTGENSEDKEVTANMIFGKIVDEIINSNAANGKPVSADIYANPLYPAALKVYEQINGKFGTIIKHMQAQVAYTGYLEANGFILPVKALLDLVIPGEILLENKITFSADVRATIARMGYINQVWIQKKLSGAKKAYIMIHSMKTGKTELILITDDMLLPASDWWAKNAALYGTVKVMDVLDGLW